MLLATHADAQEIALFKLTDVSGRFDVLYDLDENRNGTVSRSTLYRTPVWQEQLIVRTQSYIYHPAFLSLSIGGGPVFVQSECESKEDRSKNEQTVLNFNTTLSFLSRKWYPFSLHYVQSYPQTSTGASGSFSTKTNEYGAGGLFRPTSSRFRFVWNASHREASGSGAGAVVDDNTDRATIYALIPYSKKSDLKVSAHRTDTISESGNVGLPIQESRIISTGVDLSTNNEFGKSQNVIVNHNLNWFLQDTQLATTTRSERLRYNGNLYWDYSPKTDYNATLNFNDVDRTGSWSRSGAGSFGVSHQLPRGFSINGHGALSRSEGPGHKSDAVRARASVGYRRSLPFGRLTASARIGIGQTDRESGVDTITVFDEALALEGVTPLELSQDFVVTETVTVTNEAKTQTYVEGVDYRFLVIGATTSIERLVTGNIPDGETVLVTYDFLSGGTVEYKTHTQGLSLNLQIYKHFSLFFQYNEGENEISRGSAVTPISDTRVTQFGGQVDYPLGSRWNVGARYRNIDNESDISSSVTHRMEAYAQVRLFRGTSLQLGAMGSTVDNLNSPEDVNLLRYTVNLKSRLPGSVLLTYTGQYGEDDGGSLFREDLRHALRLDWGYRRVRFSLQADQVLFTQGDYEQTDTRVVARLSRFF
jgi:hypothetical protein